MGALTFANRRRPVTERTVIQMPHEVTVGQRDRALGSTESHNGNIVPCMIIPNAL